MTFLTHFFLLKAVTDEAPRQQLKLLHNRTPNYFYWFYNTYGICYLTFILLFFFPLTLKSLDKKNKKKNELSLVWFSAVQQLNMPRGWIHSITVKMYSSNITVPMIFIVSYRVCESGKDYNTFATLTHCMG